MHQRQRKLVGTIALIALVIFWALFACRWSGRVGALPAYGQTLVYLVLGLVDCRPGC
jgi:hypothetical protein